ncbi:MAG: VanZ family protein [Gomphosphaeria aponina SAG 52.96 = DSM 107014]|uniref:VanZ family protein n=1 Tax=Gomphosphaeria aponina SAG 52.96 = DSM 107014 TaxID=1521640 RepID=A0A941JT12_9CHRO|nr:VanZ family protein [Gomphosphaeria aponina SAG 52.96 = DSM 107014]
MKFPHLNNRGPAISAFIYLLILGSIFIIAYTGNLPPELSKIPFHDTIGHFILYGIATYLGHQALKRRQLNLWGNILPFWPVIFGVFTITEECLQSFSPVRTFSFKDMIASILGLLFGYWLAEKP